jgi:hypothetical protein
MTTSRLAQFGRDAVLVAFVATVAACSSAPRQRPVEMGPVDTGANSLEAVRRQLKGTWSLTSYEVYDGGHRRKLNASAQLTYDDFGNLTMRGEVKNAAPGGERPALLNYSGRAVIDVTSSELRLMDLESRGDRAPADVAKAADPANVRHYKIDNSKLVLTTLGATGQPEAVSTWKKAGS